MAKAWNATSKGIKRAADAQSRIKPLDWRKRMSNNIAYALLAYTGLQIFVTMGRLNSNSGSLLPYFALILLIGGIIPACRWLERRWERLSNDQAADPELTGLYRRDQLGLWLVAIGLPFAVTGMFMALAALLR